MCARWMNSCKQTRPQVKLLMLLASSLFFSPFGKRFSDSFNLADGSNSERLRLWKEVFELSLKNPFGVGIGNLPLELLPSAKYRDPIYAHNLYLDISSEMGTLSLFVFFVIIISAIIKLTQKANLNLLYLGIASSLIVFAFHSLVETPLYSVHVLALFFIILSFANESSD